MLQVQGEWETDDPWPATAPAFESGVEWDGTYTLEDLERFLEAHPEYEEQVQDIREALEAERNG